MLWVGFCVDMFFEKLIDIDCCGEVCLVMRSLSADLSEKYQLIKSYSAVYDQKYIFLKVCL